MSDLKPFIAITASGTALTEQQAEEAFELIMSGQASPVQISSLLTALAVRGESVAEITGAARIMRAKALPVTAPNNTIDTCGTGGSGSGKFNVSTAVAIVVAACGV
ncbi:MAG: anthranilate phosphoribosyltransferase, partial [Rhodospirillaceae bacterium]